MREYAEIGIGREARRTFDLEQLSIVPQRRTRSSKDVDTTCLLYTSPSPRDS